jgi:hypothetical protein
LDAFAPSQADTLLARLGDLVDASRCELDSVESEESRGPLVEQYRPPGTRLPTSSNRGHDPRVAAWEGLQEAVLKRPGSTVLEAVAQLLQRLRLPPQYGEEKATRSDSIWNAALTCLNKLPQQQASSFRITLFPAYFPF